MSEFVQLIRSLALLRTEKELYDFGMEVASRSGILALYRAENTPDAQSALDNIEELLNSMQLFKEQVDAEIRNDERQPDEQATVEEWLQNIMLLTDMDKDASADDNKVTLMTVHSAKGLEYKYVYIVGVEENLFPSQRAMESPDGMEEERRLFYVALTRAKTAATISYAEMRFKWGNMEFSRPSRFLREIDSKYVQADFEGSDERADAFAQEAGGSALDQLRRRFDYRFQQKGAGAAGGFGGNASGRRTGGYSPQRSTPDNFRSQRPRTAPDPALVQSPRVSTDGMRRLGVRPKTADAIPSGNAGNSGFAAASGGTCTYEVGDRVSHPAFGEGVVARIETLVGDHKLVVDFGTAGQKTLLARFAKLTKK